MRSATPGTVWGSVTPHTSITRLSRTQISMRVMVRPGANSVSDTPFISPSRQATALYTPSVPSVRSVKGVPCQSSYLSSPTWQPRVLAS